MEKTITLQILGRTFTFQTESDAPDAKKVAALFEEAVKNVQHQYAGNLVNVDKETLLILTGLNIASEKYKIEERYQRLCSHVTEKSAVVLKELEKAVVF